MATYLSFLGILTFFLEYFYFFKHFLNPYPRTYLLILEMKGERNIDQLPPIHTSMRDRTCYLGMCPDQG